MEQYLPCMGGTLFINQQGDYEASYYGLDYRITVLYTNTATMYNGLTMTENT